MRNKENMNFWPANDGQLRALWLDGVPTREIAAHFNRRTNAVTARAIRIGLPPRTVVAHPRPEPRACKKCGRAAKQRGTGKKTKYIKWFSRHLHRVEAEKKIGRPLVKGEIVHHINGDSLDNRPENLAIMTQAEHASLHSKAWHSQRRSEGRGR